MSFSGITSLSEMDSLGSRGRYKDSLGTASSSSSQRAASPRLRSGRQLTSLDEEPIGRAASPRSSLTSGRNEDRLSLSGSSRLARREGLDDRPQIRSSSRVADDDRLSNSRGSSLRDVPDGRPTRGSLRLVDDTSLSNSGGASLREDLDERPLRGSPRLADDARLSKSRGASLRDDSDERPLRSSSRVADDSRLSGSRGASLREDLDERPLRGSPRLADDARLSKSRGASLRDDKEERPLRSSSRVADDSRLSGSRGASLREGLDERPLRGSPRLADDARLSNSRGASLREDPDDRPLRGSSRLAGDGKLSQSRGASLREDPDQRPLRSSSRVADDARLSSSRGASLRDDSEERPLRGSSRLADDDRLSKSRGASVRDDKEERPLRSSSRVADDSRLPGSRGASMRDDLDERPLRGSSRLADDDRLSKSRGTSLRGDPDERPLRSSSQVADDSRLAGSRGASLRDDSDERPLRSSSKFSDEGKFSQPRSTRATSQSRLATDAGDAAITRSSLDRRAPQEMRLKLRKLQRPLPANLSACRYDLVEQAAKRLGFSRCQNEDFKSPYLIWTDSFISQERLTKLRPYQRVNHFPGMASIGRKDELSRWLAQLAEKYQEQFSFAPRSWRLPEQLEQWQQHKQELQQQAAKPSSKQQQQQQRQQLQALISKPVNQSGTNLRDTKIYPSASAVPDSFEADCVLQEYVQHPFLIEGRKFELRVFALVTSCEPLRVYFYNDGVVRMSGERHVEPSEKLTAPQAASHYTDPVRSPGATQRNFQYLNDHLQRSRCDVAAMWRGIVDIVVHTLLLAQSQVLPAYRRCRGDQRRPDGAPECLCFELLGFDILLDRQLRPWLLEVNRSPNLGGTNSAEKAMKLEMLQEALMLLDVQPAAGWPQEKPEQSLEKQAERQRRQLQRQKLHKQLGLSPELLAKLQQHRRIGRLETKVCCRFRRVFPVDDSARQEKLVGVLLDLLPPPLAREQGEYYKALAAGHASNKELFSDNEEEEETAEEEETKWPVSTRRRKEVEQRRRRQQVERDQLLGEEEEAERQRQSRLAAETQQSNALALSCLEELKVTIPGKSARQTELWLDQAREKETWLRMKQKVGQYWLLKLDAGKRQRVLGIARSCAAAALRKCLGEEKLRSLRLLRLFDKMLNWMLACSGHNLWSTFAVSKGEAPWLLMLRQQRPEPSEHELLCCARLMLLCHDCLLVVFAHSQLQGEEGEGEGAIAPQN